MAVATRPATETTIKQLKGFDQYVDKLMRAWKVPGTSIGIVVDGEIVLAKGYGLRNVAQSLPTTTSTLMPIGSVTKMFTTMALALLADEGLLDWDTPVRQYLPTFTLWDSFATERMTPRDLTTHRSGLPRHDLMWYKSDHSRQVLFDRLRYLEPTTDFRTRWQYQNLMYMTAGYLIEKVSGLIWEDFVRTRIFEPLGMVSTVFDIAVAQRSADVATGYRKEKNRVIEMPYYQEQFAVGPAGSIISNIDDMSKWLQVHVSRGKRGDERFVSEKQITDMHAPHMIIGPGKHQEMPHSSYGLGWFVEPYRGHNVIHHGGNIDGFSAMMAVMPDKNVGIVVLTNMNGTPIRDIIPHNLFDRFIDGKQVDWSGRWKKDFDEIEAASTRGKAKQKSDRITGKRPSHKLEEYAGTYTHPGYGTLTVAVDGTTLGANYNSLEMALKPYHYDIFEMIYKPLDFNIKVSFSTDVRGDIAGVSVPLEPGVKDIMFTRVRGEEMRDRAFLEKFTGVYELMGAPMTISFKEDVLQVSISGQPEHELEPIKGTEFALKGLSGASIEFDLDGAGNVTAATVSTSGMVLTAKKQ